MAVFSYLMWGNPGISLLVSSALSSSWLSCTKSSPAYQKPGGPIHVHRYFQVYSWRPWAQHCTRFWAIKGSEAHPGASCSLGVYEWPIPRWCCCPSRNHPELDCLHPQPIPLLQSLVSCQQMVKSKLRKGNWLSEGTGSKWPQVLHGIWSLGGKECSSFESPTEASQVWCFMDHPPSGRGMAAPCFLRLRTNAQTECLHAGYTGKWSRNSPFPCNYRRFMFVSCFGFVWKGWCTVNTYVPDKLAFTAEKHWPGAISTRGWRIWADRTGYRASC